MELCWVGSVRLAELHWQRRQVYRLRLSGGLIGLEAPAAAGQADRRRRASRDFGVAPGDGSKLPARAWLVPILLRSAESHHSIDRHYGQLFGQAQLVRHPVFLWPSWGSQVAYAKPWAPGKKFDMFFRVAAGDDDGYCWIVTAFGAPSNFGQGDCLMAVPTPNMQELHGSSAELWLFFFREHAFLT